MIAEYNFWKCCSVRFAFALILFFTINFHHLEMLNSKSDHFYPIPKTLLTKTSATQKLRLLEDRKNWEKMAKIKLNFSMITSLWSLWTISVINSCSSSLQLLPVRPRVRTGDFLDLEGLLWKAPYISEAASTAPTPMLMTSWRLTPHGPLSFILREGVKKWKILGLSPKPVLKTKS